MGRASLCNAQQDAQRLPERLPEELKHLPMRVGCAPVLGSCSWECREVTQGVLETDLSIQHLQGESVPPRAGKLSSGFRQKRPFLPLQPTAGAQKQGLHAHLGFKSPAKGLPKEKVEMSRRKSSCPDFRLQFA